MTQPDRSDLAAGLVFIAIAAAFAWSALDVRMGTLLRMGPGYFPLVLSALLAALGALMLLRGARQLSAPAGAGPGPSFRVAWRPLLLVCGSALFFALTLGSLGLPLATFATLLIAASASPQFRPAEAPLTAAAFAVGSWVVFSLLLGLPFRAIGTWIGG